MSLTPHAIFKGYLTVGERQALEDAFADAGVDYDRPTRARLLDGVNRRYVRDFLPLVGSDDATQLANDLRLMNGVERLIDGTVPLTQWLRNAVRRFSVVPERKLFEDALRKVSGESDTTTPAVAAKDAPAIDFEEILTDDIDDLQDVSFLGVGASRLPAVAKLLVPRFQDGKKLMMPDNVNPIYGAGTGWLVASDLVFTNYHVIRNRGRLENPPSDEDLLSQALGTRAQFSYDADEAEGLKIPVRELVAVGKEQTRDFALLRLAEKPNIAVLPLFMDQVQLPEPEVTPKGTVKRVLAANIIQHPGGGPKRVALRNNLVYKADYPKLHYFTDTLGGSSGSPVFNDAWRVVALHRAAIPEKAEFQGKTVGYVNEGIQIHAILADLAEMAKNSEPVKAALDQILAEQAKFNN